MAEKATGCWTQQWREVVAGSTLCGWNGSDSDFGARGNGIHREVEKGGRDMSNLKLDNDRLECISESHLQYMREFIRREEVASKKTLDLFLAEKLKQAIDSKLS
jgi:hypothetical protein